METPTELVIFREPNQHCNISRIFSSPRRSPGRAIVLTPGSASASALVASALAKYSSFYVKVFYVMGKGLSGELSCPCDRSCYHYPI